MKISAMDFAQRPDEAARAVAPVREGGPVATPLPPGVDTRLAWTAGFLLNDLEQEFPFSGRGGESSLKPAEQHRERALPALPAARHGR